MKLQHEVNDIINDLFSDLGDKAKLTIFTDAEMQEYKEEDSEDFDYDEEVDDGDDVN